MDAMPESELHPPRALLPSGPSGKMLVGFDIRDPFGLNLGPYHHAHWSSPSSDRSGFFGQPYDTTQRRNVTDERPLQIIDTQRDDLDSWLCIDSILMLNPPLTGLPSSSRRGSSGSC
jgi:hypothetical protein